MPLTAALAAIARAHPHAPPSPPTDLTLTYGAFERQVAEIAGALRHRHSLAPGDRVALFMENCGAYFPLLYGCWRAGLAPCRSTTNSTQRSSPGSSRNAAAKLVLISPTLADSRSALRQPTFRALSCIGSEDHRALTGHDDTHHRQPFGARRRSLAVLHLRHHGPPERRNPDAAQFAVRPATPTTPTSTSSTRATACCTQRHYRTAPAFTASPTSPRARTRSSTTALNLPPFSTFSHAQRTFRCSPPRPWSNA